jgi:hypothetical protein
MRSQGNVLDENVQFTAYRPQAARPNLWYPMLTFAYPAERRDQGKVLADQALRDMAGCE